MWQAYQPVEANKGAPGMDGKSLEGFETDQRSLRSQDRAGRTTARARRVAPLIVPGTGLRYLTTSAV